MQILLQKMLSAEWEDTRLGPGYVIFIQDTKTDEELENNCTTKPNYKRMAEKIIKARLWDSGEDKKWENTIAETEGKILLMGNRLEGLANELYGLYIKKNIIIVDPKNTPVRYINDGPFSMLLES